MAEAEGSSTGESAGEKQGSAADKIISMVKEVKKAPWDPLNSPDWDKESHSKEALLRIKRCLVFTSTS